MNTQAMKAGSTITSRDSQEVRHWEAARQARDALLVEMGRRERGLWGLREAMHYESERYYRAVRQLIAAGVFDGRNTPAFSWKSHARVASSASASTAWR